MEFEVDTENQSINKPTLKTEPESIDFGCLKAGEERDLILKVTGGPGRVTVNNDQLKVFPSIFGRENSEINIKIVNGFPGELIWDNVILQNEEREISVPILGRWELTQIVIEGPSLVPPIQIKNTGDIIRSFKGKACSHCGRNFSYDSNSDKWEQCSCPRYKMIFNISLRIVRELRVGIKDFPTYVQEMWNIILGKQKW